MDTDITIERFRDHEAAQIQDDRLARVSARGGSSQHRVLYSDSDDFAKWVADAPFAFNLKI